MYVFSLGVFSICAVGRVMETWLLSVSFRVEFCVGAILFSNTTEHYISEMPM